MGPSGAGKTSLMTLLRGRAHYGNITGSIAVSRARVELHPEPKVSRLHIFVDNCELRVMMFRIISMKEFLWRCSAI
jgi:Fe-S cluster assembly ATPase SufC